MKLPDFFEADHASVEAALEKLLPPEKTPPPSIHRAMRYSVFAGGKRIRPILCLEAARMFTENIEGAVHARCALEFIHTYSLIHDDLPALDNDDLRRGKPTCHKVFGEALAILAGDALLTLAFQTLAAAPIEPARRVRVIAEIAAAAGTVGGMVGGQVADLEAERKPVDAATLEYIHRSKTAALIRGSIVAGAIAGGAAHEDVERLRGSAKTSAGRFRWSTTYSMWKNPPPRSGRRPAKTRPSRRPPTPRSTASKNRAPSPPIWKQRRSVNSIPAASGPCGCGSSRNISSRGGHELRGA